ncbi:MAG: hypothetical protein C0483_12240 [Pirellula sp.]|nr:hypothetical protein [Pirellula sp.]
MSTRVSTTQPPPAEHAHEGDPAPLQFRLKTLLILMGLAAGLFAALQRVSAPLGAVLIWSVLLVAAHVTASALGTHSTARAPTFARRRAANAERGLDAADGETRFERQALESDPQAAIVPTTRLGGSAANRSAVQNVIVFGAGVGSVVGTTLIWRHNHGGLDWSSFLLAACSSAVIGAFLTFLSATCFHVTSRAWREASRHASSSNDES